MKAKVISGFIICAGIAGLLGQSEAPQYYSPIALVANPEGSRLYVLDDTGSRLIEVDSGSGNVVRAIPVAGRPTGLAINRSGNRLYLTVDEPVNSVLVVDTGTGKTESTIAAGHGPTAPVLNSDETILYICDRFDNNVGVVDLRDRREIKRIPVIREPLAAALSPDGKLLVVGNQKPDGTDKAADVASSVSLIETQSNSVSANVRLLNGGTSIRNIAISSDNHYAYVSHLLGRTHVPATQLEQGWLNTNAVSVIDLESKSRLSTVLLDQVGRGAGNPWGIAVTPDGKRLTVALAGVHQLAVIDLPPLLEKLRNMQGQPSRVVQAGYHPLTSNYPTPDTDLTFLEPYLRRIPLKGKGPRPILLQGQRAYLGMYFSGTIESIDLGNPKTESTVVSLGTQPAETDARRGERLFHDATVSFQGWQSCSTCHPDGRSDGLNWDLTNDGVGTVKNTKSLLFAPFTPPLTWTGIFPTIDGCVAHELKTIVFATRPPQDISAIVAFLKSLKEVPSPYLEKDGKLSAAAQRGQLAFTKAGCIDCHKGEYMTAMQMKNVGTSVFGDQTATFDIPSLREAWRTAPYLHDGRAQSIKDIFVKFDPANKHGRHSSLSSQELDDLVQYVLSL